MRAQNLIQSNITLSMVALFLVGCAAAPEVTRLQPSSDSTTPGELADPIRIFDDPDAIDGNNDDTVCDPFNNSTALGSSDRNGLLGRLSYLGVDDPIAQSVYDFWNVDTDSGQVSPLNGIDVDVFNSWINVPTRSFDAGFFTAGNSSDALTRDDGEVLVENFSLYYQSNLILGDAVAGRYELAMIADDGSVLKIQSAASDGSDYVINNDGVHATKMKCSTQVIDLNAGSQFPLELFYHQGPRYHIALQLMWRKLGDDELAGADSSCNASGNNLFFDFNTVPSTPRAAYNDLLARGWEVIPSTSFLLPGEVTNPCAVE